MIKQLTILLIFFGLFGCKKDPAPTNCPINYQIDSSTTYTLGHTWKFIGFQKTVSALIEYPPCEGYEYYAQSNSDFEITISFSDTLHIINDTLNAIFPHSFYGKATLNDYNGSYDIINEHPYGSIMSTQLSGPQVLLDYEERYFKALITAEMFLIDNNELTIWCNRTDKMLFVLKN